MCFEHCISSKFMSKLFYGSDDMSGFVFYLQTCNEPLRDGVRPDVFLK